MVSNDWGDLFISAVLKLSMTELKHSIYRICHLWNYFRTMTTDVRPILYMFYVFEWPLKLIPVTEASPVLRCWISSAKHLVKILSLSSNHIILVFLEPFCFSKFLRGYPRRRCDVDVSLTTLLWCSRCTHWPAVNVVYCLLLWTRHAHCGIWQVILSSKFTVVLSTWSRRLLWTTDILLMPISNNRPSCIS